MGNCYLEMLNTGINNGDFNISLSGTMPDSGMCLHVPAPKFAGNLNFTVRVAKALYCLCCNWNAITVNVSISVFKPAMRRISGILPETRPAAAAKTSSAIYYGSSIRLRL